MIFFRTIFIEQITPFLLTVLVTSFVIMMGKIYNLISLMVERHVALSEGALMFAFLLLQSITLMLPIGVLGGTYLAEYGRGRTLSRIISMLSDIMVSVPSIVIGTFVYAILVKPGGHFNGWAGAVALDGQMLDEAVRAAARRTLARAGEAA